MAEDDVDESALEVALATAPEGLPAEVLDVGRGSSLLYRQEMYRRTEEVHSVTPEWANHQLALARIEADKQIKVAELTHVAPVKVMVRPLWVATVLLGAAAIFGIVYDKEKLAAAAIAGLAISSIVDAIFKKVKK